MEERYFRVSANISIDAIRSNIMAGRALLSKGTKMMAVVKADAYGHGAVTIAKYIDDIVDAYAVAIPEEGVELRKSGIKAPILVLGYTAPQIAEEAIANDISLAVFSYDTAMEYGKIAKSLGMRARLHIKLDTGMSRIGFRCSDDCYKQSVEEIVKICSLEDVYVEGMFTHFCRADEADKSYARYQFELYKRVLNELTDRGISISIKHVCNSAGVIDIPEADLDMVRFGITMYGMYPTDDVTKERLPITPALELKTHISMLKDVPVGTGIGYSQTFVTKRPSKIATIPVGYGDGYPRGLTNRGRVLIHGKFAPICGRICMDQCMVDVTDIPEVKVDDVVTLIGHDGDGFISAEEIGETVGNSFHYEVVCDINKRVPRVYIKDGKIVDVKSY